MNRLRAIIVCIGLLGAVLAPLTGDAQARVVELGATTPRPAPSCPADCFAIGRLTGFQVKQGPTVSTPYQVKRPGKVVAFSVTLGTPEPKQVSFFTDLFGGDPQVRLAVLRRELKVKNKPHRLVAQSDVVDVGRYLGSTPTFALPRPLSLRKGDIVALTVPTWAPAFAVGLAKEEAWRSSRLRGSCEDVKKPAAQQRLTGLRSYACVYRTARLLYTATFIPDPRPTKPVTPDDKPAAPVPNGKDAAPAEPGR